MTTTTDTNTTTATSPGVKSDDLKILVKRILHDVDGNTTVVVTGSWSGDKFFSGQPYVSRTSRAGMINWLLDWLADWLQDNIAIKEENNVKKNTTITPNNKNNNDSSSVWLVNEAICRHHWYDVYNKPKVLLLLLLLEGFDPRPPPSLR